jgi:hypothetical protein
MHGTPELLNKLQITYLINLSLTKIILHLPLNDSLDENINKQINLLKNVINNQMDDVLSSVNTEDQDQLQVSLLFRIFSMRNVFSLSCYCVFNRTSWSFIIICL